MIHRCDELLFSFFFFFNIFEMLSVIDESPVLGFHFFPDLPVCLPLIF